MFLSSFCKHPLNTVDFTNTILKKGESPSWQATRLGWHSVPADLLDWATSLFRSGFLDILVTSVIE